MNIRISRKDNEDKKSSKEAVRRPGFYTQVSGALELAIVY